MKKNWWKALTVILLLYTAVAGLLAHVPRLAILNETIRNLYFHVPMWFAMTIILTTSMIYSIRYLRTPTNRLDVLAHESAKTGMVLGILGLLTGSTWARFTWGAWWVASDPRLNGAAIAMLIYGAYLVLRSSFTDEQQRARVSAIYNIFAYAAAIPLLFILPRMQDSLHPGAGGNPGFSKYDLDNNMRLVFYPAVIGWTLLGVWITQVSTRLTFLKQKIYEKQLA
ncbi:cytochrome c biogenesis protein CcsA [Hymenobacter jejuensis]|nr:cytochrome c biogenesis protein CcsA [Hymenobacter jejuensis]